MSENTGLFKMLGGNPMVSVVVKDSHCKIHITDGGVTVDGKHILQAVDDSPDSEIQVALSRLANEAFDKERWIITNVSDQRVTTGLCNHNVLMPGQSIDALLFGAREEINGSPAIQGAKKRGLITLEIVKKD